MGNRGFGNMGRSSRDEAGGGGGVTGAQNGLSLVGTDVELGGPLLHLTEIDLDSFPFFFKQGANELFNLQSDGSLVYGDVSGAGSAARVRLDTVGEDFNFTSGGNTYLGADVVNGLYRLGDIDGVTNGMAMRINDAFSVIHMGAIGGFPGNNTFLELNDGTPFMGVTSNFRRYLNVDISSNIYSIGDLDGGLNNTFFEINDTNQAAAIKTTAGRTIFEADNNGGLPIISIGDLVGAGNNTHMLLDDSATELQLTAQGGFSIDQNSATPILDFITALDDQAGASVGTLNNAPGPGDPSKWFFIRDGGNNFAIPAWSFV